MKAIPTILILSVLLNCSKKDDSDPKPGFIPIDFGSSTFGTVSDNEGNSYKTITIGSATWMAENLRVLKYRNGDDIDKVPTGTVWEEHTTGGVFRYHDDANNQALYGYLYNSFAKTDPRGVCPSGWHIPASDEWEALAAQLGGIDEAGTKMKEAGTAHWITPGTGDNSSGFTGMPGGSIHNGLIADIGTDGYWWSAEDGNFYYLTYNFRSLRNKDTADPDEGLAIRCVKD